MFSPQKDHALSLSLTSLPERARPLPSQGRVRALSGRAGRFLQGACMYCTVWPNGMWHRKWRETKQQPGRARSGNQISCCLVTLHFLCVIPFGHAVLCGGKSLRGPMFRGREREGGRGCGRAGECAPLAAQLHSVLGWRRGGNRQRKFRSSSSLRGREGEKSQR